MRILMSAYACEPNRGSEPEVGWRWAHEMGQYCEVTVITRSNNREVIEAYLKENEFESSKVSFVYIDLSRSFIFLKRKLKIHELYYVLWQYKARKKIKNLVRVKDFDLVHLVTFASFRYPNFLGKLNLPVVWGPVGGGEVAPWNLLFYKSSLKGLVKESIRNVATIISKLFVGILNPTRSSGGTVIASTPATKQLMERRSIQCDVMPTIGVDIPEYLESETTPIDGELKLLFVGRLVVLKGLVFILEALAKIPSKKVSLTILGDGPLLGRIKSMAVELGLEHRIHLKGYVKKSLIGEYYRSHHVVVAPSLYESGGYTVLEGFQHKRPAIVMDVGGLALSVDETCGIKVAQRSVELVISDFAKAITKYCDSPELICIHGEAGYLKLKSEYAWSEKGKQMLKIYKETKNKLTKNKNYV